MWSLYIFYLEKAYDTVWKHGVIRDHLQKAGLRCKCLCLFRTFYPTEVLEFV